MAIEIRIPTGPLDDEPTGAIRYDAHAFEGIQARTCALTSALDGIPLGAHDRLVRDWAATTWDTPTVATLCSLLVRVRAEGAAAAVDRAVTELGELEELGWVAPEAARRLRRALGGDQ